MLILKEINMLQIRLYQGKSGFATKYTASFFFLIWFSQFLYFLIVDKE